MWVAEQLLYLTAKSLYRSELAHSQVMKDSLANPEKYRDYRFSTFAIIEKALKRFEVPISDKVVVDLGCYDGAITKAYLAQGAKSVIGVDIDAQAIATAERANADEPRLSFRVSSINRIPLADESIDSIISYDVFEHVSRPAAILAECHRILSPGGKMLIGTWGWKHPYAPHLWATMPVPWAHCLVSERTLLRVCRRVYQSRWYVPNMYDLDETGRKIQNRYSHDSISLEYLNKLQICDFEKIFRDSGLEYRIYPEPFGSRYARWTRFFLKTPWIREFITAYIWVVLQRSALNLEPGGKIRVR
jgi:2-polyprenyl-3-methyl-5-hydroxy-6-metoxy-1,4-benzoquinol methylase